MSSAPLGGGSVGGGSLSLPGSSVQPASPPVTQRVRAYFAPVNRTAGVPVIFDAATVGQFDLDAPPEPWVDLGWIQGFKRSSESVIRALGAGAPAATQMQVRQSLNASVQFQFASWGKLQAALASASEQMNVLAESNGAAVAAARTASGCTATSIVLGSGSFSVGDVIAIDADYGTQTGFVGIGAAAAYIQTPSQVVNADVDYIRRVTVNVGKVSGVANGVLTLAAPLLGGSPAAGLGVQKVVGFQDRDGGLFFQEWSALFAMPGVQGDCLYFHYPRLQAVKPSAEVAVELSVGLDQQLLAGNFCALPVTDERDGATVLCYRTYVPASMMAI